MAQLGAGQGQERLEGALEGKEYLVGPLTVADFSVVSGLNLRSIMGFDLAPYPRVQAWVARMEARDSVKRSLPPV